MNQYRLRLDAECGRLVLQTRETKPPVGLLNFVTEWHKWRDAKVTDLPLTLAPMTVMGEFEVTGVVTEKAVAQKPTDNEEE